MLSGNSAVNRRCPSMNAVTLVEPQPCRNGAATCLRISSAHRNPRPSSSGAGDSWNLCQGVVQVTDP
jgi:hypothetical protein